MRNNRGILTSDLLMGIVAGTAVLFGAASLLKGTLGQTSRLENERQARMASYGLKRSLKRDFMTAFVPRGGETFAPIAAISKSGIVSLKQSQFVSLVKDLGLAYATGFPQLKNSESMDSCPGIRIVSHHPQTGAYKQVLYYTKCVNDSRFTGTTLFPCTTAGQVPTVVRVEKNQQGSTIDQSSISQSPTYFGGASYCLSYQLNQGGLSSVQVNATIVTPSQSRQKEFNRLAKSSFALLPVLLNNLDYQ